MNLCCTNDKRGRCDTGLYNGGAGRQKGFETFFQTGTLLKKVLAEGVLTTL